MEPGLLSQSYGRISPRGPPENASRTLGNCGSTTTKKDHPAMARSCSHLRASTSRVEGQWSMKTTYLAETCAGENCGQTGPRLPTNSRRTTPMTAHDFYVYTRRKRPTSSTSENM